MVLTNEEITNLDLIGVRAFPMDLIEGLVVGLLRGCQSAGVALVKDCSR